MTTTDFLPQDNIVEIIDIARGSTVRTRNLGRDIGAVFKTIAGGEIESYTKLMSDAREQAIDRMLADAKRMNADAVINVRFVTAQVMQGASEVIAYGTAVKITAK